MALVHGNTPHLALLIIEIDAFFAGFLLFGITTSSKREGAQPGQISNLEAISIMLQLVSFSIFVGAILTGIAVGYTSKLTYFVLFYLSVIGILCLFATMFTASAVLLLNVDGGYENDHVHEYWIAFCVSIVVAMFFPLFMYLCSSNKGKTSNNATITPHTGTLEETLEHSGAKV